MPRILLTWELGGGLGHLARLRSLASALVGDGYQVHIAVPDPTAARLFLAAPELHLYQAPVARIQPPKGFIAAHHAELLALSGFADAARLTARLRAWRQLYRIIQPDLLIADSSPTALAAARGTVLATMALGTGFFVPPAKGDLPWLQPWRPRDKKRSDAAQGHITQITNQALRTIGAAPLPRLQALFHGDGDWLATFPELDHCGPRRKARYRGLLQESLSSELPHWPEGSGERLLVYMTSQHAGFPRLLEDLRRFGMPTILYAGGSGDLREQLLAPNIRVVESPIDLPRAAAEADLVITHGGHGTCAATLLAGRQLLVLPKNLEQMLLAFRLQQAQLAVAWLPGITPYDPSALLRQALEDGKPAQALRRFADRYRHLRPQNSLISLLKEVRRVLARRVGM